MKGPLKRVLYFPLIRIIAGIALCFYALVTVQNYITKPFFYSIISSRPIAGTIVNYISVAVLLASYYYLFRYYERRKITELSVRKFMIEWPGGFVMGFLVLSVVILILYLAGYYSVAGISGFSYLLAPFSVLVVAALLEELFFRLIIYRILEQWIGTYWALALSTFAFALPHLENDHVYVLSGLMMLVFGFAHGAMYLYTGRLWLPFAFHLGWNLAQPFYGSNLSGIEDPAILQSRFEGPTLLTGSDFGIEDSILSIIFLLAIGVVFFQLARKKGKIVIKRKGKI